MNAPARRLFRALFVTALLVFGQAGPAHALQGPDSSPVPQAPGAQQTPSGEETLTAEPSLISTTLKPGSDGTVDLVLRAGARLDVSAVPVGLGQEPDGGFSFVLKKQDASPYTARDLLHVSPRTFRMEKGEARQVKVRIKVPRNAGQGSRYALIQISGQPVPGDGNVGVAVALGIAVIITLADTSQNQTGSLEGLAIDTSVPGEPLGATALLQNDGNAHFGAQPNGIYSTAALSNASGETVATARTTLTGNSVVPRFARLLDLPLAPSRPLVDGRYRVEFEAGLADGTVLDRAALEFEMVGGAVLEATGVPATPLTPATGGSTDGLILILSGLIGALAAALALAAFASARRRRRRRTAREAAGR